MKIVIVTLALISTCLYSEKSTEMPVDVKSAMLKHDNAINKVKKELKAKEKKITLTTINILKKKQQLYAKQSKFKVVTEIQKQIDYLEESISDKIPLAKLTPIAEKCPYPFEINKAPEKEYSLPKIKGKKHNYSYFIHAPSKVTFKIPVGAKSITGYCCCPLDSATDGIDFIVMIDEKEAYKKSNIKGQRDLDEFKIRIPQNAKKISFITEERKSAYGDHAYMMDVNFIL